LETNLVQQFNITGISISCDLYTTNIISQNLISFEPTLLIVMYGQYQSDPVSIAKLTIVIGIRTQFALYPMCEHLNWNVMEDSDLYAVSRVEEGQMSSIEELSYSNSEYSIVC